MKNKDTFNVHSTFLVHTPLVAGLMLTLSLGSVAHWLQASMLGSTPIPLNSSQLCHRRNKKRSLSNYGVG